MTESKYTDEQIIEALEVSMPHDEVYREAYNIIHRQAEELGRLQETNKLVIQLLDKLRVEMDMDLKRARSDAIGEFARELINEVVPQFNNCYDGFAIRMTAAIYDKAIELRNNEITRN